jgi:hypothetical protein
MTDINVISGKAKHLSPRESSMEKLVTLPFNSLTAFAYQSASQVRELASSLNPPSKEAVQFTLQFAYYKATGKYDSDGWNAYCAHSMALDEMWQEVSWHNSGMQASVQLMKDLASGKMSGMWWNEVDAIAIENAWLAANPAATHQQRTQMAALHSIFSLYWVACAEAQGVMEALEKTHPEHMDQFLSKWKVAAEWYTQSVVQNAMRARPEIAMACREIFEEIVSVTDSKSPELKPPEDSPADIWTKIDQRAQKFKELKLIRKAQQMAQKNHKGGFTEEQISKTQAEFAKRQAQQFALSTITVIFIIIVSVFSQSVENLAILRLIALVVIIILMIISFINWHCPNCGRPFGRRGFLTYCPKCGIPLKP